MSEFSLAAALDGDAPAPPAAEAAPAAAAPAAEAAPAAAAPAEGAPPERKRRSRWGDAPAEPGSDAKKKSRWGGEPDVKRKSRWGGVAIGGQLGNPHIEHTVKLAEINKKIACADTLANMPGMEWSPSPEPIYDKFGKRQNTKGFRLCAKLEIEKTALIDDYLVLYPHMRGTVGYQRSKIEKKVMIPVDEFPNYNFFGLIVGPRGSTQKRLERETGAKVIIRGRGSLKEGQSRDGDTGMDEPMHVLITGDSQESVDKAANEITMMINPDTEQHQEHKAKQLQELAVLNGTLRDDTCYLCGQRGHRQQDCPDRNRTIKVNVKCAICGDGSHPTHDCPLKRSGADKLIVKSGNLEDEYDSFMAELDGKPSGGAAPPSGGGVSAAERKELPPWLQGAGAAQGGGGSFDRMASGPPPPWATGGAAPMAPMPPMPYGQAPMPYGAPPADPYAQQQQQYPGYADPNQQYAAYGQQQMQQPMYGMPQGGMQYPPMPGGMPPMPYGAPQQQPAPPGQ